MRKYTLFLPVLLIVLFLGFSHNAFAGFTTTSDISGSGWGTTQFNGTFLYTSNGSTFTSDALEGCDLSKGGWHNASGADICIGIDGGDAYMYFGTSMSYYYFTGHADFNPLYVTWNIKAGSDPVGNFSNITPSETYGCMDKSATNYNPIATKDTNPTSCEYPPTLKLVKIVNNDQGGNGTPADWELNAVRDQKGFTDLGNSNVAHTITPIVYYTLSESPISGFNSTGYSASTWSCDTESFDLSTQSVSLIIGENATCTITNTFIPPTQYTLTYTASANGTITGTTPQAVGSGLNGTIVTAVANSGYHFVNWSDDSTTNPRTDTNVTENISVTANFAINFASDKDITAFSFLEGTGVISGTDIAVTVPNGTNVTALIPTIIFTGVSVSPFSLVAHDFTNPVTYTVTAADDSTKVYTVTVTITPPSPHSSGGGYLRPQGQVLGASTGPIEGCDNRTTGFSTTTGQSCVGNTGNGQVLGAEKFIFTLSLEQTTPPPYPKETAYVNEVTELQKFLNAAGDGPLVVDGKFGPLTKVALIKFQIANGLVGDGIVGALTRAALNK